MKHDNSISGLAIYLIPLLLQYFVEPVEVNQAGFNLVFHSSISALYWLLVTGLSVAFGRRLLVKLEYSNESRLSRNILGFALGTGSLSYIILGISFLGILNANSILFLLILLVVSLRNTLDSVLLDLKRAILNLVLWARKNTLVERSFVSVCIGILGLTFFNSLSPPWGSDSIVYHLPMTLLFLERGGIYPELQNWFANGPALAEFLFILGMTFDDDIVPKLFHFSYGIFLIAASGQLAKSLNVKKSWLTIALLLGVPILPIWSSIAHVDLTWAFFEIVVLITLYSYQGRPKNSTLILAGIFFGFAMGTKYLGLWGLVFFPTIFPVLTKLSINVPSARKLVLFVGTAILVASPWYLKNWVWFDNPVFPFYWGGGDWSQSRVESLMIYLSSYGYGTRISDLLQLPWRIYSQPGKFGTFASSIDIPNIMFLCVFMFPFIKKSKDLGWVIFLIAFRSIIWVFSSQQTRFLIPIYPFLAIATTFVISGYWKIPINLLFRKFLLILPVGLMLATLFFQVQIMSQTASYKYVLGIESREQFLKRNIRNFGAIEFIGNELNSDQRMLLFGDGSTYYCGEYCVSGPEPMRFPHVISGFETRGEFFTWLSKNNILYLLISLEQANTLISLDNQGIVLDSLQKIFQLKSLGMLEIIYQDHWSILFQVNM